MKHGASLLFLLLLTMACAGKQQDVIRDIQRDVKRLTLQGNKLFAEARYDDAARTFDRARLRALSVDDRAGVADSLNNLGRVYRVAEDSQKAEEKFLEAENINRELSRRHELAVNLTNLGELDLLQKRFTEAEEHFSEALSLEQSGKNKEGKAVVLNHLSVLLRETGNVEESKAHAREALGIAESLKRHRIAATSFSNLGALAEIEENDEAALHFYTKALEEDRLVEYVQGIAHDLFHIGRLLSLQGKFDASAETLSRAFAASVQLRNRKTTLEILELMMSLSDHVSNSFDMQPYRDAHTVLSARK